MILKMWVKFNAQGVECFCNELDRECDKKDCEEYVVHFSKIKRIDDGLKEFSKSIKQSTANVNKLDTELRKTLNACRRL